LSTMSIVSIMSIEYPFMGELLSIVSIVYPWVAPGLHQTKERW
jgi:hypothetical protein